ncbi:hypothetical protein FPV67DRAFT_1663115 [Lyophyllum atratum]|nr:hypothetical protein FPV67DRAFT_1663115 [Lyophyllum atratum]
MPSTSLILTLTLIALHTTLTAAVPVHNSDNAYTEGGGHASGGDVDSDPLHGPLRGLLGGGLVDVLSHNAGDGGDADSGNALGGIPGLNPKWMGWAHGGGDNNGNAYTGPGGKAPGGSVKGAKGIISILSGNAGDGGDAESGSAFGGGGGFGDDSDEGREHRNDDDGHEHHDDGDGHEHHEDDHGQSHGDHHSHHDHGDHHSHRDEDCDC